MFTSLKWIRTHLRELSLAIGLLLAVIWAPDLIRLYDPTSASMDGAFLQLLLYGALLFACGLLLVWLALSVAFPTISYWIDRSFRKSWWELAPWQQICLTLLVTFGLMAWAAVALLTAHLYAPPL